MSCLVLCFACSLTKKETPMFCSPSHQCRGSNSKTTTNQTLFKTLFFSSKRLAPLKHLPPVSFEGRWLRNKQTSFPAPLLYLKSLVSLPSNQHVSERIQTQKISLPHLPCAVQGIWGEQLSVLDCCPPPALSDRALPSLPLCSWVSSAGSPALFFP